jgi:uncharacterized protein with PQ loop repeat
VAGLPAPNSTERPGDDDERHRDDDERHTSRGNVGPGVDTVNLPVVAGAISTSLFAASMLPMLLKAVRTRDLTSYSLANIATSNVANVIHSVYVFSLPCGPIWLLHSFYLVATALMLVWYLRFGRPAETTTVSPSHSFRTLTVTRSTTTRPTLSEQEAAA